MSNPIYENIKRDPRYAQLVQRRGRFANTLALTVIGVFFSFVLLVAFMPSFIAQRIWDDSNITIGSAYLREMHDKWGDLPHAIAAYNAGPTPTTRWRTQRPDFDPDLWIETISYKETREYVARVLAFSVIYDWRMNGDALRVSDRIAGKQDAARVKFACPQPATR